MRVSKEKAAENRERFLSEAARLFRERGVDQVGVDALAEAAGLTHGSLYSQFGSKERLAVEALRYALEGSAAKYSNVRSLPNYGARYLSTRHRDAVGEGCAIAAFGCEMPRHGAAMRRIFTQGVRRMIDRVKGTLGGEAQDRHLDRDDEAMAIAATLVGAIILARAVDDKELSDRILAACRSRL